jgi:hypothetical protein
MTNFFGLAHTDTEVGASYYLSSVICHLSFTALP